MKILWVSPNFLHPTTKGGQIRTLEMLRRLHARHEIHYVAYADPEEGEGPARSHEYCSHAYPIPTPISAKGSAAFLKDAVVNLARSLPLAVSRYGTPEMARQIAVLREQHRFDSLVCDFLFPAPNIPDIENWVLFQHNVESVIWQRRAGTAENMVQRHYLAEQHQRMAAYEGETCRRAGFVVAVSDVDAETMRSLYGVTRVGAVATGVDTEFFRAPENPQPVADLVFVGSMDWMPNVDGIRWFVSEVLPLIHREIPDCTLAIAGRRPGEEIVAIGRQDSRVHVSGTVPDIRPYLWGAKVSIVPLRIGGGTRLKIYEAMAAGVPVVSTSIGAEGLDVHPPLDIRLADSPAAFASECVSLLKDSQERRQISEAGRQLVEYSYSWEHAVTGFESYLQGVLAEEIVNFHEQ